MHKNNLSIHLWKELNNKIHKELNDYLEAVHNSPAIPIEGFIGSILNKASFLATSFLRFISRYSKESAIVISSMSESSMITYLIKTLNPKIYWVVYLWDPPAVVHGATGIRLWFRMKYRKFYQYLFLKADHIVIGIHPMAVQDYKFKKNQIVFSTNGVDTKLFHPENVSLNSPYPADTFNLLIVEKGIIDSGIEDCLKAINKVLTHIPNLLLHIVGLWEHKAGETLFEWSYEFGIADHVKYHGVQPHERLPDFIRYADICLNTLPSGLHRDECYPLKIFTYLAMGKALISSESPAVRKLVQNKVNGLLVKPQDSDELFNAILLLHNDTSLRSDIENRARQSVLAYDWEKITYPFIIKIQNVLLTSRDINELDKQKK